MELDGLRGFAVLGVVIYHMNLAGALNVSNESVHFALSFFGVNGVHIFFIISGFIITTLLIKEKNREGRVSLSAFYTRRFFRIIPPFAFYLIILYLCSLAGYLTLNNLNFLWSSLFLSNIHLEGNTVSTSTWFFSHSWSLSVEEQYYLLFPPLLTVLLKFRLRPVNRTLIAFFFLSLLSLKVAKEASLMFHPSFILLAAFFQFRYIIVGVFLAFHRERIKKLIAGSGVIVPLSLFISVLIIYFTKVPTWLSFILTAVDPICFGIFVFWFVENPEKCKLLRWKSIQWIGSCSYSIYLWQQLFTGKEIFYNGWTISQSPSSIIPILLIASLSYYFIEMPIIRFAKKLLGMSKQETSETVPLNT